MKKLLASRWAAPVAAVVIIGCGGGAAAQFIAERNTATVNKNAPGRATFDPALVSRLRVPPGFAVNVFASGLGNARMMETGPDGTVYLTRRNDDDVLALRDADGDGVAETRTTFASGLDGVHAVAVRGADLYVASSTTIWRAPLAGGTPQAIVTGLPDGGQHPNPMLRFGPDGDFYFSIGSSCNDCAEANQLERGTIIQYAPDGTRRRVLAKGLRNTIGYDWHPATGQLWGMDHGSDFRGDDIPPEELNRIVAGANYGWPICYGPRVVDPMTNAQPRQLALRPGETQPILQDITRQDWCAQTEPSVLTTTAHSAPMAMRFYTATQFPVAYRNSAFVAMRGSWNAGNPVGYKVVLVRFAPDGTPTAIEDFMTGFLSADGSTHFGRPVGVTIAADGTLLVSDDTNGVIYRIRAL